MDTIKAEDSGKIKVADVTLAQLSRGLYRSNATVFKELINNAYDADAQEVRIDTNFPEFDYISVVDNGRGMPIEKFIDHFADEGIGSSNKRRGGINYTKQYNRPIIGRLGIGMMSIGQLCHSFEIESHYIDENGEGKAYKAGIVLTDSDIPRIKEKEEKALGLNEDKELDVGKWNYELIDYDESKRGLRIFSLDVRGTFRREMKESYETDDEFRKVPFSLQDIANRLYKLSSIRDSKPYLETIWELCVLSPLPYFDDWLSPTHFGDKEDFKVNDQKVYSFLKERSQALEDYQFKLIFDGILLKRLIRLPTAAGVKPLLYFIDFERKVFDSRLKFTGYIFVQVASAIKPRELNGIQIRLRNVGIGGYDSTYLNYYKQVETVRTKWVSGEIFVDQGLEAALNIDRDSFNEHEEHYKALQKYLHDFLDKVFEEATQLALRRSNQRSADKLAKQGKKLNTYFSEVTEGSINIREVDNPDENEPVVFNPATEEIVLNKAAKAISRKKGDQLYKNIESAYYIAQKMAKTEEERHRLFSGLLLKILREIV